MHPGRCGEVRPEGRRQPEEGGVLENGMALRTAGVQGRRLSYLAYTEERGGAERLGGATEGSGCLERPLESGGTASVAP